MFKYIILSLFNTRIYNNFDKDKNLYNEKIDKALKYQKSGDIYRALKIYQELYPKLKYNNCIEDLALVVNNMIVIKKELNDEFAAKKLFKT